MADFQENKQAIEGKNGKEIIANNQTNKEELREKIGKVFSELIPRDDENREHMLEFLHKKIDTIGDVIPEFLQIMGTQAEEHNIISEVATELLQTGDAEKFIADKLKEITGDGGVDSDGNFFGETSVAENKEDIEDDILSLLNNLSDVIPNSITTEQTIARPPARKKSANNSLGEIGQLVSYYLYICIILMGLVGMVISNRLISLGIIFATISTTLAPGKKNNPYVHLYILGVISVISLALLIVA